MLLFICLNWVNSRFWNRNHYDIFLLDHQIKAKIKEYFTKCQIQIIKILGRNPLLFFILKTWNLKLFWTCSNNLYSRKIIFCIWSLDFSYELSYGYSGMYIPSILPFHSLHLLKEKPINFDGKCKLRLIWNSLWKLKAYAK